MSRREPVVLAIILVLIALLALLVPGRREPPPLAVWGIRPGMAREDVVGAFGRAPLERWRSGGREVWVFGRVFGQQDAVVLFDREERVAAVRGSAVDLDGRRVPLPLDARRLDRFFEDARVNPGEGRKYYPGLRLGFQLREALSPRPGAAPRWHATMVWLGGPDDEVLRAHQETAAR
jgi:hypothetical protein